jgi:hypothetical protein
MQNQSDVAGATGADESRFEDAEMEKLAVDSLAGRHPVIP